MKNMNQKLKVACLLGISLSFFACNSGGNNNGKEEKMRNYLLLEKASWLMGDWKNQSEEGLSMEIWKKENDSTFSGISFFVVGKDTVSSESISLTEINNELFYIPVVKDQNEGKPVPFKMTGSTGEQLVFENPEHDFPQMIRYRKIAEDSLVAEISGVRNGETAKRSFPMKKIQ